MKRRNTLQREIVFNALNMLKNHPTADEVYDFVSSSYPSVSRATVYRNLNILAQEGEIRKIEVPNGPDRYDHNKNKHYHAICMKCQRAFDVDMPLIENLTDRVKDEKDFVVLSYDIVFKGICRECKEKQNNQDGNL